VRLENASLRRWHSRLIAEDFPALDRPMNATSARPSRGNCLAWATVVWKRAVCRRDMSRAAMVAAASVL
jgi:hypothetical protein